MKSNSLSNEPWKKMVIDGPSIPARERELIYGYLGCLAVLNSSLKFLLRLRFLRIMESIKLS